MFNVMLRQKHLNQTKQNMHLSFTGPQITTLFSVQITEIGHRQDFLPKHSDIERPSSSYVHEVPLWNHENTHLHLDPKTFEEKINY